VHAARPSYRARRARRGLRHGGVGGGRQRPARGRARGCFVRAPGSKRRPLTRADLEGCFVRCMIA
jgi:hypothetical protein